MTGLTLAPEGFDSLAMLQPVHGPQCLRSGSNWGCRMSENERWQVVQQTSSLCVRHTEESPLKWIPLGPPLCVRNMEVSVIQGLLYTSGRCCNVFSGCWVWRGSTFRHLHGRMMLRKASAIGNIANIDLLLLHHFCMADLKTGSGRRVPALSSEFCTVQILLGLGNLSTLWNMGSSAFQRTQVLIVHKHMEIPNKISSIS